MHPILFSIGQVNVYTYGVFVALSFCVTLWIFYLLAKKNKLWQENIIELAILVFIFIIVFARLAFFVSYYNLYFNHWYEVFYLWQGGLISYGGILGMILAFLIFFRKNLLKYLDILAVSVSGGGIFWRIGGIFSGSYKTIGNFPAIWLEILFLAIGFGIFLFLYMRKIFAPGRIFFAVLIYYGILRLVLDFWRDYTTSGQLLNSGQITGIALAGIGIVGLVVLAVYKNKE